MKKYILAAAVTTILAISFQSSSAQNTPGIVKVNDYKNIVAYAPPTDRNEVSKNESSSLPVIHFKAMQDFMTTYPTITNESWEKLTEGFVARFVSNAVRTMNYYDKKGRWLYSIQQYDETQLRKDVRAVVKTNYYDYSITSVQEVNMTRSSENPIYIVHIKNGTTYKTVRLCNDEMEEILL